MNITESATAKLLEQNGWHFMGFYTKSKLEEDELSEVEKVINDWEIQVSPFVCVNHASTGAWWTHQSAQFRETKDIKALIYQGLRQDLERLVEAA